MESQACWCWWDINQWCQMIWILLSHTNLAVKRVELMAQSWFILSLVTGKRQKVLLHLTLYLSVVFLIRDIWLYCTVCCTVCQSHYVSVTWGYYFANCMLEKQSVSLFLFIRTMLTFPALLRWVLTWLWNAEN